MSLRILSACLVSFAALAACAHSQAATVGYHGSCWGGNFAPVITTAGHAPVQVVTLNAATLATLDGLIIEYCGGSSYASAEITAAVKDGLVLIVHDWNLSGPVTASQLPGGAGIGMTYNPGTNIDFPAGSPIINGPGGLLTNSSLDGGNSSYHGYVASGSSLPSGAQILATTGSPSQAVTFSYAFGAGRVVFGGIPLDAYLEGAALASNVAGPGMRAYAANLIAWAVPSFVSCGAEGFTGAKLTLCRQVCEIDQSPSRLTSLIKLYMAIYRSEPPCAR